MPTPGYFWSRAGPSGLAVPCGKRDIRLTFVKDINMVPATFVRFCVFAIFYLSYRQ